MSISKEQYLNLKMFLGDCEGCGISTLDLYAADVAGDLVALAERHEVSLEREFTDWAVRTVMPQHFVATVSECLGHMGFAVPAGAGKVGTAKAKPAKSAAEQYRDHYEHQQAVKEQFMREQVRKAHTMALTEAKSPKDAGQKVHEIICAVKACANATMASRLTYDAAFAQAIVDHLRGVAPNYQFNIEEITFLETVREYIADHK